MIILNNRHILINFILEIYMKFVVDESPDEHIDLFTEIDRNHEKIMLADGKKSLC